MSDFSKNPTGTCALHSNNCTAWTQVPEQGPIFKKNKKEKTLTVLKTGVKEIKATNKKNQEGMTVIILSSGK